MLNKKTQLSFRLVNRECKLAVDDIIGSSFNLIEAIFRIRRNVQKHGEKFDSLPLTHKNHKKLFDVLPNIKIYFSNDNEILLICDKNICLRFQKNMTFEHDHNNILICWHKKGYPMIVGTTPCSTVSCFVISFHLDFTTTFKWKCLMKEVDLNFGFQVLGFSWSDIKSGQVFNNHRCRYIIDPQSLNNTKEFFIQKISNDDSKVISGETWNLPGYIHCRNKHIQYTPSDKSPLLFVNEPEFAGFKTHPYVFWPELKKGFDFKFQTKFHYCENNINFYFSCNKVDTRDNLLRYTQMNLFCLKFDGQIYKVFFETDQREPFIHHWIDKLYFLNDDSILVHYEKVWRIISFEIDTEPFNIPLRVTK